MVYNKQKGDEMMLSVKSNEFYRWVLENNTQSPDFITYYADQVPYKFRSNLWVICDELEIYGYFKNVQRGNSDEDNQLVFFAITNR